jgi:Asp-tRNA(Asn)/Glu-tRNA(Gln) amidotransferase C subunit
VTDLSKDDVRAMGKAVSLDIGDQDLAEVTEVLNAIIESIDEINPPGLESVEPLPIILPEERG